MWRTSLYAHYTGFQTFNFYSLFNNLIFRNQLNAVIIAIFLSSSFVGCMLNYKTMHRGTRTPRYSSVTVRSSSSLDRHKSQCATESLFRFDTFSGGWHGRKHRIQLTTKRIDLQHFLWQTLNDRLQVIEGHRRTFWQKSTPCTCT